MIRGEHPGFIHLSPEKCDPTTCQWNWSIDRVIWTEKWFYDRGPDGISTLVCGILNCCRLFGILQYYLLFHIQWRAIFIIDKDQDVWLPSQLASQPASHSTPHLLDFIRGGHSIRRPATVRGGGAKITKIFCLPTRVHANSRKLNYKRGRRPLRLFPATVFKHSRFLLAEKQSPLVSHSAPKWWSLRAFGTGVMSNWAAESKSKAIYLNEANNCSGFNCCQTRLH